MIDGTQRVVDEVLEALVRRLRRLSEVAEGRATMIGEGLQVERLLASLS
jgi:hypothetical protein